MPLAHLELDARRLAAPLPLWQADVAQASIADLLAMPEAADIEFEPPRLGGGLCRPADLS